MISVTTFTFTINQLLPEPHAGLLSGILFGTKAMISNNLYEALVTTGTLHIVALSGMNITILESLIAGTLLPLIGRRLAALVTIILIIGFVLIVGPSPSVIRAAIMGSMALIAVLFGRQNWSILSFILTVSVMLLVHPTWITELSFQLSVGSTLGIILFGKKQKNIFLDDLRTTLSAQVFTIPLIFFTFQRISLVSPITNVLIGWIIQPITVLGLIIAVVGSFWLPAAVPLSWISWVMLEYLIVVIEWTAKIPFASLGK